jgi:hypothetical protein
MLDNTSPQAVIIVKNTLSNLKHTYFLTPNVIQK